MDQILKALEKINGMEAVFSFDKNGKIIADRNIHKGNFALENLVLEQKKIVESPVLMENQSNWFQFTYEDRNLLFFSMRDQFVGCIFQKNVEIALIRLTINVVMAKRI